jgi:DNA-binding SARP family transcriptional activator/tetratricopeptide (TPR) repeat protein
VAEVRIEVLGPLHVFVDGVEQRLGGRRERSVLGLLVAQRGRAVSPDLLIEEIWGGRPPATAAGSLQVAVSRLRTVLNSGGDKGSGPRVTLSPAGYTLSGVTVDAEEFTRAAASVTDRPGGDVVERAAVALALWRGDPYADLRDLSGLTGDAARLVEDRLRLAEAHASALLDRGRPDEARATMAPLVDEHPFRERLWTLLALALFRCHRQADALETLRRLRTALAEELGVDPSAAVRRLEQDILGQADHPTGPDPGGRVVGRLGAIATLEESLERLIRDGAGGCILITGEAGIGKSTLATELGRRAELGGARVVVGRCHEADVSPAYWPWLPVLRTLAGSSVPAEVAALIGETPQDLPDVVSAGAAALRTYDAVASVLGAVPGPLVVVLEDLHWADTSSLRLLAYVAEALRDRPVLLVGTARDVAPASHPALTQALAALARLGAGRLRVPPLRPDAVGELLLDVVAVPDPGLAELVWRRTDGNPFFVLELTRLLAASGAVSLDQAAGLDVPDGIADVLRLRLLQLPQQAQETLAVASVAGRHFDPGVIADALGRPVLDDLDQAVAGGIVATGDGSYRFVHALTRETAYADLAPGQRARWHARVGAALADRADPDLVAEVAHHCDIASSSLPDQVGPAIEHGAAAAAAAERRGAFEEAAGLWTRTAALAPPAPRPDPERRHRLLLRLATALQRLGDTAAMRRVLEEAVELAQSRDDPLRMAEAATSFRNVGVWHWREMGSFDADMVDVLRDCLDRVPDVGLRARVWASLGLEYYAGWRSGDSTACGERSLELARECDDPVVLRDCLQARAVALWTPGQAGERELRSRELLRLSLSAEDEISAHIHLGTAVYHQGRGLEADGIMSVALGLAAQLGHAGTDVPLAWWRWLRAVDTSAPDVDALAESALALHRRTTVVGLSELTGLTTILGSPDRAPVAADVVTDAESHPNRFYRAVVARAVARSGAHDRARRLLGPQPPLAEYDYASLYAACMRVDALVEMGDLDALPAALDAVLPHVGEVAAYGSVVAGGSVAYYAGRALVALGDLEPGRALLARAVRDNARAGSPRWEAEARRELAAAGER